MKNQNRDTTFARHAAGLVVIVLGIVLISPSSAQVSKPSAEWTSVDRLDYLIRKDVLSEIQIVGREVRAVGGAKLEMIQPTSHWRTYCGWMLEKARARDASVETGRIVSQKGEEMVSCR